MTSVLSETGRPRPEGREGVPIAADSRADLALERLYHEHYVRLVRLGVLLLGGDVGRAEEIVQDAFVEVHRRWDRIEGAELPAYLRQTVVNRCRSTRRHLRVVDRNRPEAPGPRRVPTRGCSPTRADARCSTPSPGSPGASARCSPCATTSTCPSARSPQTLQISQGAVKTHASRGAAALRDSLASLQEDR